MLRSEKNRIVYSCDGETLWVEAWGRNGLRIRAFRGNHRPTEDWALTERIWDTDASAEESEGQYRITNGKISGEVGADGKLLFRNQKGDLLLEEYVRNRKNVFADHCSALEIEAREFRPLTGGDYHLKVRFESVPEEKIYGMGQYQQSCL